MATPGYDWECPHLASTSFDCRWNKLELSCLHVTGNHGQDGVRKWTRGARGVQTQILNIIQIDSLAYLLYLIDTLYLSLVSIYEYLV